MNHKTTMNKAKTDAYSWGINNNVSDENSVGDGGDLLVGFSWPPRSYTCTFCKREFRSAQALGGHMNVHRRDRARLRQMPSSSTNPNPYPNCNFSPYFSPTMFPSYRLQPANSTMMKSQIPSFGVHKYDGFRNGTENKIVNKSEIIRLNLEIGLLGESKSDDLDLELRLGVS